MIEKQYIELINKDIDNVITPAEKVKLQDYLSKNDEAKVYYEEIHLTNEYLNKLPDIEPSPSLKKQIINSIDFSKYSRKTKKTFIKILGLNRSLFTPKLAYAFALGLIAGIFIYSIFVNDFFNVNSFDKKDITGTIGIENANVSTIEEIAVTKEVSGKIELKGYENSFWLNVNLNSPKPFDVEINYHDQVRFLNFSPDLTGNTTLTNEHGYIKVTNSGSQHYRLLFKRNKADKASLLLHIEQSGISLYEHKFFLIDKE